MFCLLAGIGIMTIRRRRCDPRWHSVLVTRVHHSYFHPEGITLKSVAAAVSRRLPVVSDKVGGV